METAPFTPYDLDQHAKQTYLLAELNHLTRNHYEGCAQYRRLLDVLHGGCRKAESIDALPYLPVRLFKHYELLSVPRTEIVKTMTSSGTSGQAVSKIFLDKHTASFQIKVLAAIVTNFLGKHRQPMLVIDCPSTVSDRRNFSARTAGILGFSMFGRDVTYALKDDMTLDFEKIEAFLMRNDGVDVLLFGFTGIVWKHLVLELETLGRRLPITRGILLHGGGWKKLHSRAVTSDDFKSRLAEATGICRVHNYYGMVEQTGSIFMECEAGRLHSSNYSEIIIRDPIDFQVRGIGEPGLIQLVSVIPHSYPGHSLLSEDIGELVSIDNCPCGRQGRTFKVHGRIENAEVRGCSDTYAR
jgi:phenylacetate-coenzyme A ligase PaaK-like adenylate-forming protein